MKRTPVFCLLLLFSSVFGQQNKYILLDSLVRNQEYALADKTINEINLTHASKDEKIKFYYLKGKVSIFQNDYNLALESFNNGMAILGPSSVSSQAFDFHYYLSVVSRKLHFYKLSIEHIRQGRIIAKQLKNKAFLYESDFLESNVYNAQNKYDSAIHYLTSAKSYIAPYDYLQFANVENSLGGLNIQSKQYQTALENYNRAEKLTLLSDNYSNYKINQIQINKATCYLKLNELRKCQNLMSGAFKVAEANNYKDQLSNLLDLRILYLALKNGITEIPKLFELSGDLEHDLIDSSVHALAIKYNVQFKDTIIADQGKVIQKTEEELSIQSLKAQNRKRGLFLLGIIMLGSLGLFYQYTQRQRISHELMLSQEIIQKQQALQNERTRIAAEMHDDLGGGLTTIKFLGQKMLRKIDDLEQKNQLNKIVDNSQALVSNMSEIIWAMNAGFDSLENLMAYCRRYASEYLGDHEIRLSYHSAQLEEKIEFTGEKRRHVFLVFKELLHNIVKHADATEVVVSWKVQYNAVTLVVADNGVGINTDTTEEEFGSGNGFRNMQHRIAQLGGTIAWTSEKGTRVEILLPLHELATPIPNQTIA